MCCPNKQMHHLPLPVIQEGSSCVLTLALQRNKMLHDFDTSLCKCLVDTPRESLGYCAPEQRTEQRLMQLK